LKAYIKAISYYLPSFNLANAKIHEQFPEWTIDKISSKTGIKSRKIAHKNETSLDMAVKAANKLFQEHHIDRNLIDFVILCTQSPDYFLPTSACIIQDLLEIPTTAGAFDINLGCSGYVYGLSVAKGLIVSNQAKNILFITAETYSKFIHPDDKSNRTIFGDGAAANLISISGFAEILNFDFGTDGKGAKNLIVTNGGMRNFKTDLTPSINDLGKMFSSNHLFMNGAEIFAFTLNAVPQLIDRVLQKNSIKQEDIDLFVFHQANKFILESLRKKIKIDIAKFFYYLEECGNTVSSTIPIALYHADKEKKLLPNSKILLSGFGVGYSWAGTILKIQSRNDTIQ
jgi:3-oxoacyl-[acyl-carrier-protein] synthase-3